MPIQYSLFAFLSLIVFIILMTIIIRNNRTIAKLKEHLREEKYKRKTPFLNMAIDRNQLALRLINEGDIMAKNIIIEDISTVLDVGFQKKLVLKFKSIDQLKPGESLRLEVKIFEKDEPLPSGMIQRIGGVFITASFIAYVHCENMEGVPFCIEIIKEGQHCKIARIALAEKTTGQKHDHSA